MSTMLSVFMDVGKCLHGYDPFLWNARTNISAACPIHSLFLEFALRVLCCLRIQIYSCSFVLVRLCFELSCVPFRVGLVVIIWLPVTS